MCVDGSLKKPVPTVRHGIIVQSEILLLLWLVNLFTFLLFIESVQDKEISPVSVENHASHLVCKFMHFPAFYWKCARQGNFTRLGSFGTLNRKPICSPGNFACPKHFEQLFEQPNWFDTATTGFCHVGAARHRPAISIQCPGCTQVESIEHFLLEIWNVQIFCPPSKTATDSKTTIIAWITQTRTGSSTPLEAAEHNYLQ